MQKRYLFNALKCSFALFCFLYTFSAACQSDYYGFYDGNTMHLGGGVSVYNPSAPKIDCFTCTTKTDPGALHTEFTEFVVTDQRHLKQVLGIDMKVDARYMGVSGSAKYTSLTNYKFDDNSITVVMLAQTEFSQRRIVNPEMTAQAREWVKNRQYATFIKACGSHLIISERRGALAAAIVTVYNADYTTSTNIKASAKAGGGIGGLSGSVKAKFHREITKAAQEGRLNIQVFSHGGNGISSLNQLVNFSTDGQAVTKIETALNNLLGSFTSENAAPLGYFVAPVSSYGVISTINDISVSRKNDRIIKLAETYAQYQNRLNQLQAFADDQSYQSLGISQATINQINILIPHYESYLTKLINAHQRCQNDTSATACELPPFPTELKSISASFIRPSINSSLALNGKVLDKVMQDSAFKALRDMLQLGQEEYQPWVGQHYKGPTSLEKYIHLNAIPGKNIVEWNWSIAGTYLKKAKLYYNSTLLDSFSLDPAASKNMLKPMIAQFNASADKKILTGSVQVLTPSLIYALIALPNRLAASTLKMYSDGWDVLEEGKTPMQAIITANAAGGMNVQFTGGDATLPVPIGGYIVPYSYQLGNPATHSGSVRSMLTATEGALYFRIENIFGEVTLVPIALTKLERKATVGSTLVNGDRITLTLLAN